MTNEDAPNPSERDITLPLIAAFALFKLVFHLVTSGGYGYFRDELYYLACADHPALGYVDHPPLSILALWPVRELLGDSLLSLRLLPALLGAATVALVGWMARALGGGPWACVLAMASALCAPIYLALDHFYSMNAFDLFFWALTATVLIHLFESGRPRLWLVLGGVLGLGLLNKISVLWLGAGLGVGLVASKQRRWLFTPWPWLAGILSAVLFLPHIAWQVRNGWPTLEFIHNATGSKMATVEPVAFLLNQILMMLPATAPLWIAGLVYLLFHRRAENHRALGWIYLTVLAILMLSGSSRANYLAAAYTWLLAAGGVAVEHSLRDRARFLLPIWLAVLLLMGMAFAPLAVPVLSVESYIAYAKRLGQEPSTEERKELGRLGQFYADMHGWEEITDTVVGAYEALPPEERANARVLAPDYGVAGAIDFFGREKGLPPAMSGHNNYWLWGPPEEWGGEVLILVGGDEDEIRAAFEQVERAATIDCGLCMPYENGQPVWVARGLRNPVEEVWPRLKNFS
jgi:hypothetical protein